MTPAPKKNTEAKWSFELPAISRKYKIVSKKTEQKEVEQNLQKKTFTKTTHINESVIVNIKHAVLDRQKVVTLTLNRKQTCGHERNIENLSSPMKYTKIFKSILS